MGFGINANYRLGIALAEVYPALGEVYFHAVDVGNLLVRILGLYGREYGVDVMSGVSSIFDL